MFEPRGFILVKVAQICTYVYGSVCVCVQRDGCVHVEVGGMCVFGKDVG